MYKYFLLNILFLIPVVFFAYPNIRRHVKRTLYLLAILLVLTAIFDNLIIYSGIVEYTSQNILEVYVGRAPIEDFLYALAAVMLLPALWERFNKNA